MSQSKEYFERLDREYIPCAHSFLALLEHFDDENPYIELCRGERFPSFYSDHSIDYDNYCEDIVSDLREGKDIPFNCEQLKEVLRLNHMITTYDKWLMKQNVQGLEIPELRALMVDNNPLWGRLSKQAHKILACLRKPMPY